MTTNSHFKVDQRAARGLLLSEGRTRAAEAARIRAAAAGERRAQNGVWTGAWAAAWYITILVSLFVAPPQQWTAAGLVEQASSLQRNIQLGASVFIVLGVLSARKGLTSLIRVGERSLPSLALLAAVLGMFLNACLRPSITEVLYVGVFALSLLLGLALWSSPPRSRLLFMRAVVASSTIFSVAAFAIYGAPVNRYVGGIHPNLFGFVLVATAGAPLVLRHKLSWLMYVFALASAIAISSRYSILIIMSLPAVILWTPMARRAGPWAATIGTFLPLALAAAVAMPVLSEVFRLDDPSRGLSSGISGRAELTAEFLPQIAAHPLSGYGFRLRENYLATHNGYLNTILENGVVISIIVFAAVLIGLLATLTRVARRDPLKAPDGVFSLYMILGGVLGAAFQPQLINFGDAQGALLILTLGYPCAIAAPRPKRGPDSNPAPVQTGLPAARA